MKSIWTQTTTIQKRSSLSGDKQTQIAIIGAGMAGILTGYFLQQHGYCVTLLEANRISSGQTSKTTAKITSQHNLIYHRLLTDMGQKHARQYLHANEEAINQYESLIHSLSIPCEFERRPAYLYTTKCGAPLAKEEQAIRQLGIHAELVKQTELPFSVTSALRMNHQAQFHPLKFIQGICGSLTIYENSPVQSIKENRLYTPNGSLEAESIIFACHYPFINIPGYYFSRMYQEKSYAIALKQVPPIHGMYLGIDDNSYSLRQSNHGLLLGGESHKTGSCPKQNPYHKLKQAAKCWWPDTAVINHWSAQDCMTLDHVPFIGKFSSKKPNWYVATGFGKWGMTSSMVSAMILSDLIRGRKNPYEEVFSPQRFPLKTSLKRLGQHGASSVKNLTLGLVPNVPRCTHLGCRLQWNHAQRTWSCPCHGSEFTQNGDLLNGPAQKPLAFSD